MTSDIELVDAQNQVEKRPDGMDDIGGKEVETLAVVGGEDSMPDDRQRAVQTIDEAVVESPFQPTERVVVRDEKNHTDALKVWAQARQKLDPDFDIPVAIHSVVWPDADIEDLENEEISEVFDARNETMMREADALVVVTNGGQGDYLSDVKGMVEQVYDNSIEDLSEDDVAQVMGL